MPKARLPKILAFVVLCGASSNAFAQKVEGSVVCVITENRGPASGMMVLQQAGKAPTKVACGSAVIVSAGLYTATLSLDGALDKPEQRKSVEVKAANTEKVIADFSTGVLQVQAEAQGKRAAAMATITKDGRKIASLGTGVAAHLSTGTYDVVIRYRGKEKRFDGVNIVPGQRQVLSADFE